ncbi:hypothetical protein OIE63_28260 [Streptomyces sp. NBC_01795]|uniref:hypothetical protein n=1 Tax=unclassified Streptomyces TaxID=2593676 RepID=UPI002DD9AFF7|nr:MULTISPECIES: hypothetical protein [unclassified Streptomyces]WSA95013.1 hypothetical protein OIE63_28260 [Streptomyces sp. NBC_01795]WSS12362.1 hypothetical protein OG533_10840 [Streptomyces sp. NBC_01186]
MFDLADLAEVEVEAMEVAEAAEEEAEVVEAAAVDGCADATGAAVAQSTVAAARAVAQWRRRGDMRVPFGTGADRSRARPPVARNPAQRRTGLGSVYLDGAGGRPGALSPYV